MDIKGKIAVITGASRGIGKEIALAFCREGATVALCDINAAQLEATAAELAKEGLTAAPFALDVASFSGTEETMKKIVDNFGRVDILINNAGITKDNLMLRMKENEWDAVINVNLKGTFNCIKSVSKYMLKQKSGKSVNISSIVGIMGNAGQANYSASKAGIIGLTKSCAKEFASRGINVNAVAPGFIMTEMTEKLPEEVRKAYMAGIPLGKFGTPADIASLVLFLSSGAASYITGEVIKVDGGLLM